MRIRFLLEQIEREIQGEYINTQDHLAILFESNQKKPPNGDFYLIVTGLLQVVLQLGKMAALNFPLSKKAMTNLDLVF